MSNLLKQLEEYRDSDYYPFHMPGHKRRNPFLDDDNGAYVGDIADANAISCAYGIDITEIDGFDDLHDSQGVLRNAQSDAAKLYGSDETFFLVNGSTCGILSAITAVTNKGDKILVARNCHKSVYHAIYLQELETCYLYPDIIEEYGIADAVNPEHIERALKEQPEITAVIITSPTYEGVVANVGLIANITHKYGKILIVDEAHGAHFGFHEAFPENAVRQGADLVIHSLHKTLPAMTQTALLHVKGSRVNRKRLKRQLKIFQTSSPSYVLMASIDSCMNYMRAEGTKSLNKLVKNRDRFNRKVSECTHLKVVQVLPTSNNCMKAIDLGKIVIAIRDLNITGQQLYQHLSDKYHLQLEMAADSYVIAILTVMDTWKGLERLAEAIVLLDKELPRSYENEKRDALFVGKKERIAEYPQSIMTIAQAAMLDDEKGCEQVPLSQAADRIAAEFINLYPPGIPIIVPGEKISKEVINQVKDYLDMMLNVQGVKDGFINIINMKDIRGDLTGMRKTKIICTIGPASESEEKLRELMLAGMNVARFNFSHGDYEEHERKYKRMLKVSGELKLPIASLLDTKGPEIRLCDFKEGKAELVAGQKFILTTKDILGDSNIASITYKNLKNDIKVGMSILIDDGLIEMVIDEITDEEIICTVVNDGVVSNHKGVNVPNAMLSMPYINESDKSDIIFGCKMDYDFIAASFTRCKEDILEIRKILDEHKSHIKIIAKIENMQGIQNLEEILSVADGIMVARGDMGVEVPMEEVPVLQKKMIKMAEAQGKHVITATQMLESMISNPRPTRAEATDVANAIYDGTTAIMLSGETAAGQYPVEAVTTMARIAERTERDIDYTSRMKKRTSGITPDVTTAISHATCTTASDLNAAAIITVTISGFTAGMISRYKPNCPIIACTVKPKVCRQLNLSWGVVPILIEKEEEADNLFEEATQAVQKAGFIKNGDVAVLTAGVPLGISGRTNMIRVIEV